MKRMLNLIMAVIFVAALVPVTARAEDVPADAVAAAAISTQAETTLEASVPETYSNEIESKTPPTYGTRRTSFLGELDDGGYQMVVYSSGVLYVTYFDSAWNTVRTQTVELELPRWGGVYLGEMYNYVVCGQSYDTSLTDGGEVYRVIKYDKAFQRLDSISFTSSETYTATPFYYGNLSMDESEDTLTVYTSRLRKDGHQSNIALRIYTADMTVCNVDGMGSAPDIHVSHSFRQIVKYDADTAVHVDLSDAYPVRSVYIQYDYERMPLLVIPGTDGDNVTNAEVSGLEISDTHYFAVGTYLNFEEQNVYLSCVDKQTAEVKTRWLTASTAFEPKTLYAPRIVKIAEDRFVVMWNVAETHSVQYLILDAAGNVVCAQKGIYGTQLTDCEPIFSNGEILWLSVDGGIVQRHSITDFSEEGTYEWIDPIVEAVDPWDGTADTSWYQEEASVFSISTAQQLAGLSELAAGGNTFSGKTVNLENDIFMNDLTYTHDWPSIPTWEGTFNGNGYTIYNIYQYDEIGGLFQTVGANGIVKAVNLAQGVFYSGGCIADLNQGIIAMCSSRSLVYESESASMLGSGAICNDNQNLVYGCRNYGTIIGESVFGIVGVNSETMAVVSQCSNLGTCAGINSAGGIVGYNYGWVYNNYSKGLISGIVPGNPNEANYLAGIVRYQNNYNTGVVESCYSMGAISYSDSATIKGIYAVAPSGIVNGYSQLADMDDQNMITVLSADEMRSAVFVDLLNRQTNTVLPAWVMDTELINDGYPITVADYNYQRGIYKIQPELWLEMRKVVSLKPGDTITASCESYYNEKAMVVTVEDSSVASVSLSGGNLTVTALQNGETYVNIHFDETENVIATDYRIKVVVGVYSGYCGDTATWSFDEATGALCIEGSGAMYDYSSFSSNCAPWFDYRDQIRSVRVEGTIVNIGDYAFYQCSLLSEVTLSDSVVSVSDYAFAQCIALPAVVIPKNVATIGEDAFSRCSALSGVTFMGNAPSIGEDAFYSVTANIYYPNNDDTWTADIMLDYGGTLSWVPVTPPHDWTEWITVTEVGCTENGVRARECRNCGEVETEEIPAPGHDYVDGVCTACGYVQPKVIASGWSGYTTWLLKDNGTLTFSGEGAMKNYTTKDGMPWYAYADQITDVVIEDGVTSVGDYAFYGMGIESITIPETVTAIGDYAFKGCTALDGVVLPAGLTKLGESAFYGCTSLTSIDIPASLWTVQPYTFKNCTALATATFYEGNLMKISDGAFYNTALTEVTLPDCLSILDVYVFKNCADLASVTLGNGITQIREASLYGTAISEIAIPEGVTVIKPYAFKNCVNLQSVSLSATLTTVDEAAFYACTALESITLPDTVTTIGNYAFRKCTGLTSVEFGSGLTDIGESSFYGCTGLTDLVIPENVITIQAYAFKGCTGVTSVSLPDALVTIGDSAFHTCTGLKTIVIPTNVETIGAYCFSGSWNLWQITFQGDAPTIGTSAFKSLVATAYYPGDNATWTSDIMQNYGGTITWEAN